MQARNSEKTTTKTCCMQWRIYWPLFTGIAQWTEMLEWVDTFSSSFYIMHWQFIIAEQVLSCDEKLPVWHSLKLNSASTVVNVISSLKVVFVVASLIKSLRRILFHSLEDFASSVIALNHAQCHTIFFSLLRISFPSSSSFRLHHHGKYSPLATVSQSMKS